jgi:hypothetical protein
VINNVVAFEADRHNDAGAWSVMVKGAAQRRLL